MTEKACSSRRPAVRRQQLLESLENRQLMAAFSANFNFQPAHSGVPANYTADTGRTFSTQGKYQYGWDADNARNTVDRRTHASDRYDTFAYLGKGANKWEVAVPNGQYRVNLTAGDPVSYSAHYVLKVENSTLINETPHSGNRWSEGSGTVTVNDGRLTLTSGNGAWNNKINSISITQVGSTNTNTSGAAIASPRAPSWASTWSVTSNSLVVGWGDASSNETGFIIEQSTNGGSFNEIARVGANTRSYNVRSLSAGTQYAYRVKAYNAKGSATSVTTHARTAGTTPTHGASAPAQPTWLGVYTASSNALRVNWGDASSNETGFIIQRSTDNRNFTEVARVGANTNSYTNTGLSAGTTYYYKVLAYNSSGSSVSHVASGRTSGSTSTPTSSTPAKPSWSHASPVGSYAGKITWGDASNNESGFIIQRSTNNSSFSEIARVAANTTSYNISGLNASTRYYFRVLAYNGAGSSAASSTVTLVTAAAGNTGGGNTGGGNTGGGNTGGGTTGSGIQNKYSLSGISANTNGDPASKYIQVLNDVGIKNVRIWYSFTNYNAKIDQWYVNRVLDYDRAGYKVMLAVLNPNVPSSEAQAKSFFQRLANHPGLAGAVDYWQINNEPNMGAFWRGSLQQYVKLNLKPAYEVLKAKGETVVGAGPSWDVNAARTLTSAGYLNYCDYAAFHPYGENANIVIQRARDARAAYNNKPMMVTEWNIQSVSNQTQWVTELNKAAVGLSNISYMNYYFALKQSATHVGSGGLLKYDGSKNTLFYNAVKGWLD